MALDKKTGTDTPSVREVGCRDGCHVWGDPYSFGGVVWYRDCIRCFEGEEIEGPDSSESGVYQLDGNVVQLAKTGSER